MKIKFLRPKPSKLDISFAMNPHKWSSWMLLSPDKPRVKGEFHPQSWFSRTTKEES